MITAQSLQDKLLALINKSNQHTGKQDVDLTNAINSLIEMQNINEGGGGNGGEEGGGGDTPVVGTLTFSGNGNVLLLFNGSPVPVTGKNGNMTISLGGGSMDG